MFPQHDYLSLWAAGRLALWFVGSMLLLAACVWMIFVGNIAEKEICTLAVPLLLIAYGSVNWIPRPGLSREEIERTAQEQKR